MAAILFGIEKALKGLLQQISEDYNISFDELEERYLVVKDGDEHSEIDVSEVKPAPKTKPSKSQGSKTTGGGDRPQCSGKTTKGSQCKKLALSGCEFCSVHQAKDSGEVTQKKPTKKKLSAVSEEDDGGASTPPPKKKKSDKAPDAPKKPAKKTKKNPPTHSHPVDEETHEDCDACVSHGNSQASGSKSTTFKVPEDMKTRMMAMLSGLDDAPGEDEEGSVNGSEPGSEPESVAYDEE